MAGELELPDEVFGFGSWLLWVLATRATAVVDGAFAAGPARPSRHYGMVDGHPVPTPSLVAWLLTAAEAGLPSDQLTRRDPQLHERQKVLRTIVSRAVGGEPRLFKDSWLRELASMCGLGEAEVDLLARCRGEEGYPVDPAALRLAIARTFRAQLVSDERGPAGGAAAATKTLPRDIASFTGREPELGQLMDAAAGAAGSGGVVGIFAVGGMAGVGKTAFAVHAAHQLAERFPDGQVFLPLHGHTPGHRPVDPADALASLLQVCGVAAAQIPPDLEARTALWRDRLAGKQLLLVLDDAAGSEQVRPLLPGSAGTLVLVTSRRHLTALEDAQALSLDILPAGQATELLVRLAARPGLDPGDPEVAEITRLCGYLPLAIGMLGRRLHHHPAWTAADLAADLAVTRDRLQMLHAENLSVAAAFDLSYQDLTPAQQRLFRRLGLHPGPDTDAYAAAALDGTDLAAARRNLEALYDQYLIGEPIRGRYRLHDLIREHARVLAAADESSERDAATGRLVDYYAHVGAINEDRLARQARTRPDSTAATSPPTAVPDLPDRTRALAWLRTERTNLFACLDHAVRTGQHTRVVALAAAMSTLLRQDGPWADALTCQASAVQASRHLGDRLAEANALNELGAVQNVSCDYPMATQTLEAALRIYRDLGDLRGQANALCDLSVTRYVTGNYPEATENLQVALGIYRDLGDLRGQANALNDLGVTRYLTGDFLGSIPLLKDALSIYRDLGDLRGQINALIYLGVNWRMTGNLPEAAQVLQESLGISRSIGEPRGQINALNNLGDVRRLLGEYRSAAEALEEAIDLGRQTNDRRGLANALNNLGRVRRLNGDYDDAARALQEALDICRDLSDVGGEAEVLNEVGTVHRARGDLDRAEACHRKALDLAREIKSIWDEGSALAGLGWCAVAAGRTSEARTWLRQAQEIFERIGAVEAAADIAAGLDA